MKLVYERMKLVVEPSAGAGLAAVLNPEFEKVAGAGCGKVGVILCGANIDLETLWAHFSKMIEK